MSVWDWVQTAYLVGAVFMFGWLLGLPNDPCRPISRTWNITISATLALVWPMSVPMVVGAHLALRRKEGSSDEY